MKPKEALAAAGLATVGLIGDPSNDTPAPPRSSLTCERVEKLAEGADIIVHSAAHPDLDPAKGGGLPPITYHRQSNATDLGAMAQRAGVGYLISRISDLRPERPRRGHFSWRAA
jgi:ribonuclease Z